MFSTAAQTSDLNLDDGTLFVDASENKVAIGNTAPAEALDITGNLTLRARGYLKLQDDAGGQFVAIRAPATVSSSVTYTFPAADGSSGQSLTTDGSGTLSWSAAAPTAGTGVTVSGSQVSIGQAVATSSNVQFNSVKTTLIEYTDGDDAITIADGGHITAAGNVTVTGNLIVNGSTVTNSATNTTIEDLLIELGTGTSGTPSSDAGLILERGSSDNIFIGWDESADVFTVGTGSFTGASTGNLTHTAANAVFGTITGTSITGNSLTIDTATLVVDASNNRVGIGNASPDVSLDIGSYTDAVHVPVGTTAQRPGSPAAGYFRYNSTTSQFEGYTSSWGAIGGGSTTLNTDLFTGNGSTVDFTISQAIDSENKLIVFVDGVYQNPDAYSMPANTTLRFSAAPANGRKIAVYSVAGVVSGTNLNIDSFTGDGSDTTFTLSITPVNENNTLVYVGGVYQQKSTYSVSGTTLTFSTAPPSGASIEVATMNQTNINVPVDDTITTAKLVDANVTTAKIADNAVTADKIADNVALPGNISTTGTLTVSSGNLTVNGGHVNVDAGMSFQWGDSHERIEQSDGKIEFFTNNTEKMVLSAGKLGIATDFSGGNANSVMSAPLNIKLASGSSASVATFNLEHSNQSANIEQRLQFNAGDDATADSYSNMGYIAFGKENTYVTDDTRDSYLTFATSTNATQAERMRINSAGNVGIGTTSPSYTFTVEKAVTNDWLSRIYNTGTAEGDLGVLIRTGSEHDGTTLLAGYSASSYKFYLRSDGRLGLGVNVTAPKEVLEVGGAGVFGGDHATGVNAMTASTGVLVSASGSTGYVTATSSGSNNRDLQLRALNAGGANQGQVYLQYTGNVGIGSTSPYSNAKLTVGGGIRFSTNVWSSGNAFNVTSWATYNNNNENSVGAVYNKLCFLTIYHSNGYSMVPIISNAGGGVAYQFTCIRPDSATAEHGAIDFTVTTDGSAGNAFRIRIGSGNGNLSVERTSGSTTFGLALHVLSG